MQLPNSYDDDLVVAYVQAIIFPRYFWSIKARSDIRTLIFHGYLSFVFF